MSENLKNNKQDLCKTTTTTPKNKKYTDTPKPPKPVEHKISSEGMQRIASTAQQCFYRPNPAFKFWFCHLMTVHPWPSYFKDQLLRPPCNWKQVSLRAEEIPRRLESSFLTSTLHGDWASTFRKRSTWLYTVALWVPTPVFISSSYSEGNDSIYLMGLFWGLNCDRTRQVFSIAFGTL